MLPICGPLGLCSCSCCLAHFSFQDRLAELVQAFQLAVFRAPAQHVRFPQGAFLRLLPRHAITRCMYAHTCSYLAFLRHPQVNHTYQGNPADEVQIWEFRHPNFRRGEIHLLNDIKRKSSRQKRTSSPNRSAGGTGDNNSRADSRGGTATPSPEIPLAAVSSHHALGPLKVIKTERGAGGPPDARMGPPPDGRIDTGRPQYIDVGTPGGYRDYGPPTSARIPMPPSERPMGPSPTSATMPPHPQSTGTYQPVMGGPVPASSPRAVQMSQASGLSDVQQDGGVMVRMDDLSDRIDQIIRHASYLESQLRTMSETVYQSQQSEATTRLHTLRMLNSITNVIGRYSSTDTNEGAETRHAMIEAVYGEIGQMQAYLQIDSAALSPPTLSTPLPGSRNAPMPPRYAPGMPPSAATQSSPGSGSAQGAGPGPGPGPGPSARPRGHGPPKGSSPPPPPPLSSCHRLDSQPSPGSGAHPHPQYGFAPAPFATSELGPVRTRDSPPRYRTR